MRSRSLYRKYSSGNHWEQHPEKYSAYFARFLKGLDFKGTVVDIGCGNGRDANVFAKNGFGAFGLDKSISVIDAASKRFPSIRFKVGDAEKLGFDDGSIDAFFMINVIHYVHQENALNEVFRTLKKGGYFYVHFNIEIVDDGKVDYSQDEDDVLSNVSKFRILRKKILYRVDALPVKHRHKIMELILEKPC